MNAIGQKCGHCLNIFPSIQACGGCQSVHYCSKTCQKAAWKVHKTACKEIQRKKHCSHCGIKPKEKTLVCAQCRFVRYCSEKCQKSAWKTHKLACNRTEEIKISQTTGTTTSSETMRIVDPSLKKPEKKGSPHILERLGLQNFAHSNPNNPSRGYSADNENDLAIFIQKNYFIESSPPPQYQEFGLQRNANACEELVYKRDIKNILIHIWGEKDLSFRIAWLENIVEKTWAHPLFFLEMYRNYIHFLKKETNKQIIQDLYIKASATKKIGLNLTAADSGCYEDSSVKSIGSFLASSKTCYGSASEKALKKVKKISLSKNQEIADNIHRMGIKTFSHLLKNPQLLSDPDWVSGHSMSIFIDGTKPTIFSPEKCLKIRIEFLKQQIQEIEKLAEQAAQ